MTTSANKEADQKTVVSDTTEQQSSRKETENHGKTGTVQDDSSPEVVYEEEYATPFLPVLALFPPALPFFWRYHVRITAESLSFGYNTGLTCKTTNRGDIVQATPVPHVRGLLEWGGWGIRLNLRGETGYIAKNGPAVRVVLQKNRHSDEEAVSSAEENSKTSVYVFNCEDPSTVCDLLNRKTVE